MTSIILYMLAAMIIYDFSLHLFDLLIDYKLITKKHPLGLYLLLDYVSGSDPVKRKSTYNIFWTSYWGLATILIITYILIK